jgi:hypothetical protein
MFSFSPPFSLIILSGHGFDMVRNSAWSDRLRSRLLWPDEFIEESRTEMSFFCLSGPISSRKSRSCAGTTIHPSSSCSPFLNQRNTSSLSWNVRQPRSPTFFPYSNLSSSSHGRRRALPSNVRVMWPLCAFPLTGLFEHHSQQCQVDILQ